MYKFSPIFIKKTVIAILFLVFLLSTPISFSLFSCNIDDYINQSTPPSNDDIVCTSSQGVSIENTVGTILCSDDPNNLGTYRTDKLNIENSTIDFINCQLVSRDGSDEISITNSQISMYGSVFQTSNYQSNAINQINSSVDNSFYDYIAKYFNIYIGTNSTPLIADGIDIKRDFEILNSSRANFTSKDKQNSIFSLKNDNGGVDMFSIYLLTQKIENSVITDTFNSDFELNLSFSTLQETSTTYSYSNFSSIPSPEEIQLSDNNAPVNEIATFEYNPVTDEQELKLAFNEYVSSLNLTLYNKDGDIIEQYPERSGLKSSSYFLNVNFEIGEEYIFQFEYLDYFGNSNTQNLYVTPPEINNTEFASQNIIIYNYSMSSLAQLNATVQVIPQQFQVSTIIEKLVFDLNPSSTQLLNIDNSTQINYTTESEYEIFEGSSFNINHSGYISKNSFNSPPLLLIENSSYLSTSDVGDSYFYSLNDFYSKISVVDNSVITPQVPDNIYFDIPFQLNATYQQRDSSTAINPSNCSVSYNFLSGGTTQDLVYESPFELFSTVINFNQYLPLEKTLTISCENSNGFENVSSSFTLNQTLQPTDSFTYDLLYNPKNLGSFTTTQKELNISINSQGNQNTNSNFGNQYSIMISKSVFPKTNWNTTQNITPWINIGKNEFASFSHNSLTDFKSVLLTLQNSTTMSLNNSFMFRDIRDSLGEGTSLYVVVKLCVPPYSNNACEFASDPSQTFRFEDSTPPILYNFSIRNITNNENFNLFINIDDLESDVDYAELLLTQADDEFNTFSLPITNYESQTIGLNNSPLQNTNLITEGIVYNLSINTSNKNGFETIIPLSNQLLLDNEPPTDSSLKLLDTSFYNISPQRFYTNNGSLVELNITSGFDSFDLYDVNSGIDTYNISIYSFSNDCSIQDNLINSTSRSIEDNETQIVPVSLTNDTCNKLYLEIFDRAGNSQTLDPYEIVVDTTPPSFNKVNNLNISLKGESTTKFFNKDSLTNDSVLFSYEFDIKDNLTPIKQLTINLYEKNDSTSTEFSKVKEYNISNNVKEINFTLEDFNFKDGALYRIGVIGENYAKLKTNEIISFEEVFLSLKSSLQIEPKGPTRDDEDTFFYFTELLDGDDYSLLFENKNLAQLQCSLDTTFKNYSLLDQNQCSLNSDFSELECMTNENTIEEFEFVIVNCLIDNSEENSEKYFSKNFSFNFDTTPNPDPLKVDNSQNFTLELTPIKIHSINLSEYIINNNTDVNYNYTIKASSRNKPSNIVTKFSNSSSSYKDIVTIYTNSLPLDSSQNITFEIEDSYDSNAVFDLNIEWNLTNISNQYDVSNLSTINMSKLNSNPKNNSFEFQTDYLFSSIEIMVYNNSKNTHRVEYDYYTKNSTQLISEEFYELLFALHFEEFYENINVSIDYETYLGPSFNQNITLPLFFDINNNGIIDLNDDDLDSNSINDSLQSIIFNKSIVFNDLKDSVKENFSNDSTSNFVLSSVIGDDSDITISWNDSYNITNKWDFSLTQIYTTKKEFNGVSQDGTRLVIKRFPKFKSNKAITLPALKSPEEIIYCLKDDESLKTSEECNESDEYIINSCDDDLGNGISCELNESESTWTLFNISNTVVEELCINCDENNNKGPENDDPSQNPSGNFSNNNSVTNSSGNNGFDPNIDGNNSGNLNNVSQGDENNSSTDENKSQKIIDEPVITEEDNNQLGITIFLIIIVMILLIALILGIILYKQKYSSKNKPWNTSKNNSTNPTKNNTNFENDSIKKDLYSSIKTHQKSKSLTSYSQQEKEQLIYSIQRDIGTDKPLSLIAKENLITNIDDIWELLNLIGFDTFASNLKSFLLIHRFIDTNSVLHKLYQEKWFTQLKPTISQDKYIRDLGFFITQFKMTQIFNKDNLKEIVADCIEEEINSNKV